MSSVKVHPAATYPSIVGQLIARRRLEKGMEQADIAQKIGVTQSTWSRIERGESAFTIEQLVKAADALHCKPHEILRDADRAREQLLAQGVKVENARIDKQKQAASGLALIGAAALGGLIGAALANKAGKDE